jgi:membrane fusion protein
MDKASPLFRPEAVHHQVNRHLGTARINVPMSYRIAAWGTLFILIMLCIFVCFAQMSEKTIVRGYLDSKFGIIPVESKHPGLVMRVAVKEGDVVHKDELLFVLTNPMTEQTNQQIKNLEQRIDNLKRECLLKKMHLQALEKLVKQHFVATSTIIESETALLEVNNQLKQAEFELLNFNENQHQLITAPIDGIITNIFYHPGQSIQPSKPLVQIIPRSVDLIARLYIPAREIGFVKPGQTILLTYDAYPSQRFGFYQATIKEINQTILTDTQEDKPIKIGEPYYKIMAELNIPYVNVSGEKASLSHGMTLTATISGEKRKIWQWIADPLHRL